MGLAGGAPAWFEAGALPSLNGGSRVCTTPPQPDAGKHRLGLSRGDLMGVPQPRTQQRVTCALLPQRRKKLLGQCSRWQRLPWSCRSPPLGCPRPCWCGGGRTKGALSRPLSQVGFGGGGSAQLGPCWGFRTSWGGILSGSGADFPSDPGPNRPAFPADYKPQSSPAALPDLPAYVLFLCFRHADHCCDEPRARSLVGAAVAAVKRVMKVLSAARAGLRRGGASLAMAGGALGQQPGPRGTAWADGSAQPEHLVGAGVPRAPQGSWEQVRQQLPATAPCGSRTCRAAAAAAAAPLTPARSALPRRSTATTSPWSRSGLPTPTGS